MGGNSTQQRHTEFTTHINPRNGGAIAVEVLNIYRLSVSIPAMGGNRGKENPEHQKGNINPRNGGNSPLSLRQRETLYINPRNGGNRPRLCWSIPL